MAAKTDELELPKPRVRTLSRARSLRNMINAGRAAANPAAGRRLVFFEDFNGLGGIDMADARTAGFNFYRKQWFGGGPTPTTSIVQIAPSVVRLGQLPGQNYFNNRGRIQTAASTSEIDDTFFGNAWGGSSGAFFEVKMKWSVPAVPQTNQFGIYLFSLQVIADTDNNGQSQWPGQPAGYAHFAEVDIFEFRGVGVDGITYNGMKKYSTTQHDWAGNSGSYINPYNTNFEQTVGEGAPDWNQFHVYGANWVPQQSANSVGSMTFYFDGLPMPQRVFWKNPNWPSPVAWPGSWPSTPQNRSTPALADAHFAVIDSHLMAMQLDGHTECGMDVDWVKVWQ